MNDINEDVVMTEIGDSCTKQAFAGFKPLLETLKLNFYAGVISDRQLSPYRTLGLPAEHWGLCAQIAQSEDIRWVAGWAEDRGDQIEINVALEKFGDYLILRALVDKDRPKLPSQTPYYWAACRSERYIQDMYGVCFIDHPDPRRWIRHQAWPEDRYPLRKDFPRAGNPATETPPDIDYEFLSAKGTGVYEIPVGPVHAGIIEPGHFRFQAVGETVLNLEERLGYVHKGIEKISEGRNPEQLARIAGRISGDTTVGHTWAACMAMERAAHIEIPSRATFLRAILCERERIINHLWDMGAICNDVGFAFANYQFGRLRETWVRENNCLFGHRLLMDRIIPGGVSCDLPKIFVAKIEHSIMILEKELAEIVTLLDFSESLENRLVTTGVLTVDTARKLGALGFVGRSSGQTFDVRHDAPYPPYDQLDILVPVEDQGDVSSRFWIRYKEIKIACQLINWLVGNLPSGDISTKWQQPATNAEGIGLVEGWRGEIFCYVRFEKDNKICRFYPRDPSIINWPVLEKIVLGNIVPDFPVCNKSVNGSYSGHDL